MCVMDRGKGPKLKLVDQMNGLTLPLSKLPSFSLMDAKGNIVERDAPQRKPWRVPKSELRPCLRLVESMMRDAPRYYGGRRKAA